MLTELKCPPQSAELNPIDYSWNAEQHEISIIYVAQVWDVIMKYAEQNPRLKSENPVFQHLVEFMLQEIKAVLTAQGHPIWIRPIPTQRNES